MELYLWCLKEDKEKVLEIIKKYDALNEQIPIMDMDEKPYKQFVLGRLKALKSLDMKAILKDAGIPLKSGAAMLMVVYWYDDILDHEHDLMIINDDLDDDEMIIWSFDKAKAYLFGNVDMSKVTYDYTMTIELPLEVEIEYFQGMMRTEEFYMLVEEEYENTLAVSPQQAN
jgi:hypothetical protein